MTFRGIIKNGVIVTTDAIDLPDGTEVDFTPRKPLRVPAKKRVKPLSKRSATSKKARPAKSKKRTLYDMFKGTIGKLKGLPSDFSVNHDHYLYGVPKQRP